MPIPYIAIVVAQIFFIIHSARTGRPYYWITILLFIPLFGMLAYIVFELLPGASQSPNGRRAVSRAKTLIDPQARYRTLATQLEIAPTVANRRALADECLVLGKNDEAETLYHQALSGMHATDPATMLGVARVRFAKSDPDGCLTALDDLREANRDYQSADAHMLYARSLEALSRDHEALAEYAALAQYFGGEEPRVRRALLLRRMGDAEAARDILGEVIRSVERAPSFYRRNQREWYSLARQNIKS